MLMVKMIAEFLDHNLGDHNLGFITTLLDVR